MVPLSARAIVAPTLFNNPNLPRIDLSLTEPIAGASVDFIASSLPLGALDTWYDNINGNTMKVVSGSPTVVLDGEKRVVRFDGVDDVMDLSMSMSQPRFIALVGTVRRVNAGSTVVLGTKSQPGAIIGAYGANKNQYFNAGTSLNATPDNPLTVGRHIWVVRANSSSSALLIDGIETSGSAGTSGFPGIRLGGSHNVPENTQIDVERFVVVPGAGTFSTTREIYDELVASTL